MSAWGCPKRELRPLGGQRAQSAAKAAPTAFCGMLGRGRGLGRAKATPRGRQRSGDNRNRGGAP